jgi:exopolyphosphatase/guanosine-5'-triphosphate,3'-diphosphate pyrophosphatase
MQENIATAEALIRLQTYMEIYIEFSLKYTEDIIIIGTSGIRTAKNSSIIQNWLREKYQLPLHIISGEEEAFLNGIANQDDFESYGNVVFFDVGGGSTEFTIFKDNRITEVISLDLGIRYLQNRFEDDISAKILYTQQQLKRLKLPEMDFTLVGIGGTPTSLAALIKQTSEIEIRQIHKSLITRMEVEDVFTFFRFATVQDIENKMHFDSKQSDVITTGTMLVKEIISYFEKEFLLVSDKGLQFGIMYLMQAGKIDSPLFFKNYLSLAMKELNMKN